jgi:hypothetical protein
MIWTDPVYKERSLVDWIGGALLPVGIEELVPEAKLRAVVKSDLLTGALLFVSEKESDAVVAGVLKATMHHAEEVACFTSYQVLRGLTLQRKWSNSDTAVQALETPDVLILYDAKGMTLTQETTLDRALTSRGFRPPRVTVIVGNPALFTHTQTAYGEKRTYALRSKAPKKSAARRDKRTD